jgi:hypothetical protein
VIPQAELDRQVKAGLFDTLEISDDDNRIDTLGIRKMYAHSAEIGEFDVFWGKVPAPAKVSPAR